MWYLDDTPGVDPLWPIDSDPLLGKGVGSGLRGSRAISPSELGGSSWKRYKGRAKVKLYEGFEDGPRSPRRRIASTF